jgi:hypothetical protein
MRRLSPPVLATMLLGFAATASGQSLLQGSVIDDSTGEALSGVSITVLTSANVSAGHVVTGPAGHFAVELRSGGEYRLRAMRLGYHTSTSRTFWVSARDTITVEFRMSIEPVALDPLTVVARARPLSSPVLDEFHRRMARGVGLFITRAEIERDNPAVVSDVLRARVPGLRVQYSSRARGGSIRLGRAPAGAGGMYGCPAQIFMDGRPAGEVRIDDLVHPLDVEGIEVYPGLATVPAEFYDWDSRCGVVAIWTRRGSTETVDALEQARPLNLVRGLAAASVVVLALFLGKLIL